MVAKRDLAPRVCQQVPRQSLRSQRQYERNDAVSIDSRRNRSTLGSNKSVSANYSDAIAHNLQVKHGKYCRAKAIESSIVIAVNVFLSLAAIAAVIKLVPYQAAQQERLDEIKIEVNSAEQRVNELREKLPQALHSGKSQEITARKHGYIKNNQLVIKLLDPSTISNESFKDTTTTAQQINNPRNP